MVLLRRGGRGLPARGDRRGRYTRSPLDACAHLLISSRLMNRSAASLDLGDNAAVRPSAPAEVPHGRPGRPPHPAVPPRRRAPARRRWRDDPRRLRGDRRPLPGLRRAERPRPQPVRAHRSPTCRGPGSPSASRSGSGSSFARTRPARAGSSANGWRGSPRSPPAGPTASGRRSSTSPSRSVARKDRAWPPSSGCRSAPTPCCA